MSTRCLIAVINQDGTGEYICVNCDGYPEWVGRLLITYHACREKADAILALGDLSSLGKVLDSEQGSLDQDDVIRTTAHHRDWQREWEEVKPRALKRGFIDFDRILKESDCKFAYAFIARCWMVSNDVWHTWIPLERVEFREKFPDPLEYSEPHPDEAGKPYKECSIEELKRDFILLGKTPNLVTVKKRELIVKEVRRRGLNHHEVFSDAGGAECVSK